MREKITIVVADDHPVFREGLRRIIASTPGIEVVGEAADGETALELVKRLRPSIAILDISMPGMDGFAVARAIADENISVPVIFLTMHSEKGIYQEALNLGAAGYVLKDNAATDVRKSINAVVNGTHFVSHQLTSKSTEGESSK
jgi:DNA-binding NarL/FixJ family response regulator